MSEEDNKVSNFTKIPVDIIQNSAISPDSRMLLIYLISIGNGSVVRRENILKYFNVGGHRFQRMMKELRKLGYFKTERMKSPSGKLAGSKTIFIFKDK